MATLSGIVFQDFNLNGFVDPGEEVPNAFLFLDEDADGLLGPGEQSTNADAAGAYTFAAAPEGIPVFLIVPDTNGVNVANTPNPFTFAAGEVATFDPSIVLGPPPVVPPPVAPVGTGAIAGAVFVDLNDDGLFDPALEPTRPGVPIFIDLNNDGIAQGNEPQTVTNEAGFYDFPVLAQGTYVLRFDPSGFDAEDGFEATTSNPALVTVLPGVVTNFTFDPDEPGLLVANTPGGQVIPNSIFGRVVNDLNQNGIIDFDEPGVPGITVTAGGESGTTDGDGYYVIEGLDVEVPGADDPQNPYEQFVSDNDPSGFGRTFTVEFENPSDPILDANGNVVVPSPFAYTSPVLDGEPGLTDVFVIPGGSAQANATIVTPTLIPTTGPVVDAITGFLFEDLDGDGALDPDESGFAGATVFLDIDGDGSFSDGEPSTETNGDGLYGLFNLTLANPGAGSFPVRVDGLEGFNSGGTPTGAGFVYTTPIVDVTPGVVSTLGANVAIGFFDTNGGTLTPTSITDDAFPAIV